MGLLLRILGLIISVVVFLLTWLFRLLRPLLSHLAAAVIGWLFNLMTMAFVATITGPRQFIERRSADWTRQLLMTGMSNDHFDIAHRTNRIIITGMIVMGWALIVAGTVLIVATVVWIVT